jgi:uncharacterized membrane protein
MISSTLTIPIVLPIGWTTGMTTMTLPIRGMVLVAATLAMGLMAGLFFSYAVSVMPGLAKADDRTVVDAMQRINVAILNGWFGIAFGGALLLSALAAGLYLRADGGAGARGPLPWIVAGLVLYLLVLVITFAVNVPLNDALAAAGAPDRIADLAAVRHRFETRWVPWNVARAVVSAAGFGCLTWALALAGR